jgi:hypothetical protein
MADSSVRCDHPLPAGGACGHRRRRTRPDCGRHRASGAVGPAAAAPAAGQAAADPLAAPAVRSVTDLYSFDELREGDLIGGFEVTGVRDMGDGVLVEFEHGAVDDREYGHDDGLIEVSRDVPVPSAVPAAGDVRSDGRHVLAYSPSGATCSCGQEFNVYKTRRSAGWSEAHDSARTVNIVKANARRHADAANRKL